MKQHLRCVSKSLLYNKNLSSPLSIRLLSTQEAVERRHHLFELEKKRQIENVGRIEKIEVNYKGIPKDCTLVMNKDISTPYDCARHLSQWHAESSALALLDGMVYWDMHKPLTESCTLELQNFTVAEPHQVNKAFWRTCSMVLGVCAMKAFKDNVPVKLHSFPGPDIRSGSFIYDIDLPTLPDWKPTQQELHTLSAEYVTLARAGLPVQRLDVSEQLALEMFRDNEHKASQIPSIASGNGKVTLYKIGKYVDISKGPVINNTAQIGKVAITSVHKITGSPDSDVKQLYRFQGVALPVGVVLNHFAFSILTERAKKLNSARSPINPLDTREPHSVAATA
ncbi:39S ribosomal protein L39, mitochondrial [Zerene cesonia]|uniref:39S ribosomal protein L39, mitochondrial n=1 Tax=Zerene cesonia TaxID=33412 RepID=UPI0018E561F9|nr:39S ribosomal protein L39, mitochondrial [Zerene cesonia]